MNKQILGVIGGLGPLATAHFLELVVQMTDAATEQENVDMIIYNFPSIPDRTGYILGSNLKSPLPGLLSAGKALARQGSTCIAIPCVTAHYFYKELTAAIHVPIINCVRDTALHLRENGITCAGIMATDGTIASRLFQKELDAVGIQSVVSSPARQRDVMHLIYDNVKAGIPADQPRFRAVQEELARNGAQAIVLGCTELSLIKRDFPIGPGFLDTMEVLARESILRCGHSVKPQYGCLITK